MDKQLKQKVGEFLKKLNLSKDVCMINPPYNTIDDYKKKKSWESADRPGVYAFYSDSENLQYIGTSVLLGGRLGHYFKYSKIDGSGESKNPNSKDTKWVVTIGFEKDYWFLACALEQYLISKLNPERNKYIKK